MQGNKSKLFHRYFTQILYIITPILVLFKRLQSNINTNSENTAGKPAIN